MAGKVSRYRQSVGRILADALRRGIFAHAALKLLSLCVALLLWFVISSEHAQRDATLVNVPVRVHTGRADLMVRGVASRVVDVRVRGPARRIARLKPEDLSVWVDVSHLDPGYHVLALDPSFVQRPSGIEVLRIDPPSLSLEVHRLIAREVPVIPRFEERSEISRYVVVGYVVRPDRVRLTGPESFVGKLTQIPTRSIAVAGANSSVTVTVPVDLMGMEMVRANPPQVTVTISVEEAVERWFVRLPIVSRGRAVVIPPVVDVLIWGPRSLVRALQEREIIVTIPDDVFSGTWEGEIEAVPRVQFRVNLSGDLRAPGRALALRVVRTEPQRVRVRIFSR